MTATTAPFPYVRDTEELWEVLNHLTDSDAPRAYRCALANAQEAVQVIREEAAQGRNDVEAFDPGSDTWGWLVVSALNALVPGYLEAEEESGNGTLTLELHNCRQRHSYLVTWEGTPAEAESQALAYIQDRWTTHAVHELQDQPFDYNQYPRLYDLLYPTCEHGLSADLCVGPSHYPTDM